MSLRVRILVTTITALLFAASFWYFASVPMQEQQQKLGRFSATPGKPGGLGKGENAGAPEDLTAFAVWLRQVVPEQRGQFIRERLAGWSPQNAAAREKIRAFLLGREDVEIDLPAGLISLPFSEGTTTLRRYFLGLLEDFPAAEAVPLARTVLAATGDFREAYLSMRALERHQPDANRPEALAAMQRLLPLATPAAKTGPEITQYLAQFDRIAEPLAHYRLAELQPAAMKAIAANPFMAGRYTQAVDSFAAPERAAAYAEMFANPAVAQELVGSTGIRSANVWLDPVYREQTARFFSARMNDPQRRSLVASLAEESGIFYPSKPLAEPKTPVLQPIDPAAEKALAQARLAMVETLAAQPQAKTPEIQNAASKTRRALEDEIKEIPEEPLTPVVLPVLDPLGKPASALEEPPKPAEPQTVEGQ